MINRETQKMIEMKILNKTERIDSLVKAYIERNDLDQALRKAKLGASKKMRIFLTMAYINAGHLEEVRNVMKILNIPLKEINPIVDFYRSNGWTGAAIDAARIGTSKKRYELLIKDCIRNGWVSEVLEVLKMRKRRLSTEETDALMKACIDKGFILDAQKLVYLGASKEAKDSLRKVCIDEGYESILCSDDY
jgi:hypothetical protein